MRISNLTHIATNFFIPYGQEAAPHGSVLASSIHQ